MRKIVFFLIVALVCSNLYIYWSLKNVKKENKPNEQESNRSVILRRQFSDYINNGLKNASIKNEAGVIDELGGINKLRTLVKEDDRIVIWISDKHCIDCIDKLLILVDQHNTNSEKFKKTLLMSFGNGNDYFRLLKSRNLSIEAYAFEKKFLPEWVSNSETPCLFLLDKNLKMKAVYFVSIDYLEGVKYYLNSISR